MTWWRGAGVLVLLGAALVGCGEETGVTVIGDEAAPSQLVVTRKDGGSFVVDDVDVECVPFETDHAVERLVASNERVMNKRKTFLTEPWFKFEVTPAEVEGGKTYDLPYAKEWDDPKDMVVFLVDPETQAELSSAVEESTGTVEVIEATCDPRPRLVLSVNANLEPELGGPRSRVTGGLSLTGRG